MYDWNDLKAFLAVAETGSTLSAAQSMRVSQTTVARRIAALEEATGLNLFERRQAGYALTPVGEAMVASAVAVRDAADRFGDAAGARSRDAGGTVSLTTMEIFAVTVLPPILRDLRARALDTLYSARPVRQMLMRAGLGLRTRDPKVGQP